MSNPIANEDGVVMVPFSTWLQALKDGEVDEELTGVLATAVDTARTVGGKATVTLQLTVEPVKGRARQVTVTEKIASKLPEAARLDSLFFVDGDGQLCRDDPTQQTLPLQHIDQDDRELRSV